MSKDLKEKAINIKGKSYVQVSDRVLYFNENYPNGSITCELLSPYDSSLIVIKATVKPISSEIQAYTGHSQAVIGDGYINKTSALENAETSAVGRALAMMGIGVIESIASIDEINKTTYYQKPKETAKDKEFIKDLEPNEEDVIAYQEKLESAKDKKELKKFWEMTPPLVQDKLVKIKDELKAKL